MTWYPMCIPLIMTPINKKFMLFPLVTSSLSFGYLYSVVYGNHRKEHLENLKEQEQDKQEMSLWSSSLQDPKHPNLRSPLANFQSFVFNNK